MGYLVIVMGPQRLMSHKPAADWDEVKRLREAAIGYQAKRVFVMRWRDVNGEREFVAGPHELYRYAGYTGR